MKVIKRRRIPVTESFVEAFKDEKQEKDENSKIEKLRKTKYWPIVESFYIVNPIKKGTKDFWETKSFDKSIANLRKAIKGTLFNESEFKAYKDRKFTVEEILQSISTHKLALSPEYKPVEKKYLKVTLDQFLFNPYSQSIGKSYFLYWLHNQYTNNDQQVINNQDIKNGQQVTNNTPALQIPLIVDMYPLVAQEIYRLFEFKNLDTRERNQITKGVSLFESLLEAVTISPVHRPTPQVHAQIFHDIIATVFSYVDVEILPRNFVSPKMESWIVKGLKDSPYIV